MKLKSFCLALIGSLLVIVPVWAHHSHGNYDTTKYKNLKGKVTDDKGQTDVWALEGASVTQLVRKGWTKDAIKTGDNLTVRCHQLHDGTNGCLLGYVSIAGAAEKVFD